MEIKNRKIGELVHAEYNPRTIDPARMDDLRRSLRDDPDFFKIRPAIVNMFEGRENIIIAGNKRCEAALLEGWTEVPCIEVRVDPAKERIWNVKDNNNFGEWDDKLLSVLLEEIRDLGGDPGDTALEGERIATLLDREKIESARPFDPSNEDEVRKHLDDKKFIPLTVEAPEAPRLRARLSFYLENMDEYRAVCEFFKLKGGELDKDVLMEVVSKNKK